MSGLPLISRRRLLTAMALSPLLWQMNTAHAAAIDPNRIVALEWLPVELLLALGIVPYGVADTINYRLWVSEPPLPDSVIDVGLRTEPNLELLTEMKPSFMVWSAGYGPSPEMLARIAPGGIFAPMLALGTVLGTAFGMVAVELFPQYHLEAGTFAIAGMGALLAASIRAPLTGIILVLEMTDNYQLILPMIITGLGATLLAQFTGGKPLYSAILARTLAKQEAEQLARSKAASASENT